MSVTAGVAWRCPLQIVSAKQNLLRLGFFSDCSPVSRMSKIIYTVTDEAPMLATYSLLPVFQRFAGPMGVTLERRDISVAGRILAAFPECLTAEQRQSDDLAWLGDLAKTPEGMIVKLPNISASVPQLVAAIAELQSQGYKVKKKLTASVYQHP